MNVHKIIKKIKELFKYKFVYSKNTLNYLIKPMKLFNGMKYISIRYHFNDKTELIEDMFTRYI